jgi:hypothetical protein
MDNPTLKHDFSRSAGARNENGSFLKTLMGFKNELLGRRR